MKKYLITLLIGVLLIGFGTGVAIFEFSRYTTSDAPTTGVFSTTTKTVYTALVPNQLIIVEDYYPTTVVVDNTLNHQAKLDITTNGSFYRPEVNNNDNTLSVSLNTDSFKLFSATLDALKSKIFFSYTPEVTLTLYLNEADAKNFVPRAQLNSAEKTSNQQLRINELEQQLETQQETYAQQLEVEQQKYQQQIDQLQVQLDHAQNN